MTHWDPSITRNLKSLSYTTLRRLTFSSKSTRVNCTSSLHSARQSVSPKTKAHKARLRDHGSRGDRHHVGSSSSSVPKTGVLRVEWILCSIWEGPSPVFSYKRYHTGDLVIKGPYSHPQSTIPVSYVTKS